MGNGRSREEVSVWIYSEDEKGGLASCTWAREKIERKRKIREEVITKVTGMKDKIM